MTGLTKDVGSTWNLWWEWWSDVVKGSFAVAKLIRWSWLRAGSGVPVVRCWVAASNISNTPTGGDHGYVLPKYLTLDAWIQQEAKLRPHLTSRTPPYGSERCVIGMVPVVSRCGESCHHLVGPQIPGQQKALTCQKSCLLWCGSEDEVTDFNWIHCKAVIDACDL